MPIVLTSKFATAEDTAKELGVPKSRLKWLQRLMASGRPSSDKAEHKNGARVLTSTRKRKSARGKARNVAR